MRCHETVDGKTVERVRRVTWQPDDDRDVRHATVIGRAEILTVGGGRLDALLVSVLPHYGMHPEPTAIIRAIAWERTTRRFVAFRLTEDP